MTVFKLSILGVSSVLNRLYLGSSFGWNSLPSSMSGGGRSKLRRQICTCSAPCLTTVSFLSRPVKPPYMRSFKRHVLCVGTYNWSEASSARLQVLMARFKYEE